jgi:hypothetical protein
MYGGYNEQQEADRGTASPILEGNSAPDPAVVEERKALKREIKAWWQGVADHIDNLVSAIHVVFGEARSDGDCRFLGGQLN